MRSILALIAIISVFLNENKCIIALSNPNHGDKAKFRSRPQPKKPPHSPQIPKKLETTQRDEAQALAVPKPGKNRKPYTVQISSNGSLAPDTHDHIFHSRFTTKKRTKPLNILMILADDLGFGDTSVSPFTGTGIKTPKLEKMAARGAIMTNFHAAAPTCTPSRAALLTGMYPWRAGIKSVFEYGERGGKSNRDDWLLQVPTAPMLFAEHGYSTLHSGKWHLGGMRDDDYLMRQLPPKPSVLEKNARRCPHPGPNQQGFQKYVSVLDGPGAPRQNELQVHETLYSQGCRFLLENDRKLEIDAYNISGTLSYCEAKHAMLGISESVVADKPFYIHLWFHAPHGPWEYIPGYDSWYPSEMQAPQNPYDKNLLNCNLPKAKRARYCFTNRAGGNRQVVDRGLNRMLKYYTMVSDMDAQIGMILDHIDRLGIAKDTIIIFTSDNGPEDNAGTSGELRDRKRSIYEGGIRVPAIVQWEGTIPPGSVVNTMAIGTDVFPTFLDAAGISVPAHYKIDGTSFLPDLLAATRLPSNYISLFSHQSSGEDQNSIATAGSQVERSAWLQLNNIPTNHSAVTVSNPLGLPQESHPLIFAPLQHYEKQSEAAVASTESSSGNPPPRRRNLRRQLNQERLLLWHADFESPRRTAGIAYGFKIILDENDVPMEMFDLSVDPRESINILPKPTNKDAFWSYFAQNWPHISIAPTFAASAVSSSGLPSLSSLVETLSSTLSNARGAGNSVHGSHWTRAQLLYSQHRRQPEVIYQVLYHLYPALRAFATHGSDGYQAYQKQHPELRYPSTPISYDRPMITNVYKNIPRERMHEHVQQFLHNNLCKEPATCQCGIPKAKDIQPLPFPTAIEHDMVASVIAQPRGYVNASVLLFEDWF